MGPNTPTSLPHCRDDRRIVLMAVMETTGVCAVNGAMNGGHEQRNGTTLCLLMNPASACDITMVGFEFGDTVRDVKNYLVTNTKERNLEKQATLKTAGILLNYLHDSGKKKDSVESEHDLDFHDEDVADVRNRTDSGIALVETPPEKSKNHNNLTR
ncbi:hypothetical protein TNCV_2644241 [Trichonephila clavipes]|nr:hypothetical protein TNCV_2644241 [Trichonephila clavipes]